MSECYHLPIMAEEVVKGLALKEGGTYCDMTVGGGGHAFQILSAGKNIRLIGFDKDEDAIKETTKRLKPFEGKFQLYHSDFKEYEEVLYRAGAGKLDGVLLDLGISSHQIDDEERGFSYRKADAPLDMRMDRRCTLTAEDVVNSYSEEELCKIFKEYGEEPFSAAIARRVVREREKQNIATCGRLKEIIESAIPPQYRSAACARRVFQAIRIEVNGELQGLEECLRGLVGKLKSGGRICVLTFHSLEDRIVKRLFSDLESDCTCPKSFPVCVCGKKREIKVITKKPLVASEEERQKNPRSKSAKLRIAEKI